MALVRRTNKYGVDRPIDVFQSMLWDNLSMQFGDWDSYPRVYKNKRRKPDNREYFIAEHSHTLKEYLEILFNDKKTMVSFFIKDDQINVDELAATASVSFIVQCDLNKVYPDETERADERLKEDILFFIMRQPNFKIQQTIDGVDNVYKEFRKDNLILSNIAPRHVVRFDILVDYSYGGC